MKTRVHWPYNLFPGRLKSTQGSVMIDFWWQVFLLSIATVIVAKVFGIGWGIFLLFSVAFLGWTVLWLAAIWLLSLRQK